MKINKIVMFLIFPLVSHAMEREIAVTLYDQSATYYIPQEHVASSSLLQTSYDTYKNSSYLILPPPITTSHMEVIKPYLQLSTELSRQRRTAKDLQSALRYESTEKIITIFEAADCLLMEPVTKASCLELSKRFLSLFKQNNEATAYQHFSKLHPELQQQVIETVCRISPTVKSLLVKEQIVNEGKKGLPPSFSVRSAGFHRIQNLNKKGLYAYIPDENNPSNINVGHIDSKTAIKKQYPYNAPVQTACISNDGLISGHRDGTIEIRESKLVRHNKSLDTTTSFKAHNGNINYLFHRKRESQLLTVADDKKIILWDLSDNHKIQEWDTPTGATRVVLKGDRLAFIGFQNEIRNSFLYTINLITGELREEIRGRGAPYSIDLAADGNSIAVGAMDGTISVINLEDLNKPAYLAPRVHNVCVSSIQFNPKGTLVASGDDNGEVRLWTLKTNKVKRAQKHENSVSRLKFNKRGDLLASGAQDATVRLWKVNEGICLVQLSGYPKGDAISNIQFDATDTTLVTQSYQHMLKVWKITSKDGLRAMKNLSLTQLFTLMRYCQKILKKEPIELQNDAARKWYFSLPPRMQAVIYVYLSWRQCIQLWKHQLWNMVWGTK